MAVESTEPTLEVFSPSLSFRELADRFAHLDAKGNDKSIIFQVEGRVISKRRMSKTLGFLEISRLADDHASRDPFLCQLIIEASAEEQANGPSDAFKERFTYWNREVHLGDVIEAIGHPEKTIKGRVSLHIQHIKVVSLFSKDFPGQYFDAGRFRLEYRESLMALAQSDPTANVSNANGYLTNLPLCKWIIRGVPCKNKHCKMRHNPDDDEKDRIEKQNAQRNRALNDAHDPSDPFEDKQKKQLRASIFAKWIVEKFGIETLNSGAGALDVAGGTGRLSFELLAEHGVTTTLVEPRKLKITRKQAKLMKEKNLVIFNQIQDYFEEELWNDPDCPQVLKNCSVVIGLHPDQATEPIVDFALSHGKPFAVVPCCVFAHLWPSRTWNGKPVVVYNDFVEYLRGKDPRIQVDFLNMAGRNKVLWFNPTAASGVSSTPMADDVPL